MTSRTEQLLTRLERTTRKRQHILQRLRQMWHWHRGGARWYLESLPVEAPTDQGVAIVASYVHDPNPSVRVAAIAALGWCGNLMPYAVGALAAALCDEHPLVRLNAAHALAENIDFCDMPVSELRAALDDSVWSVRRWAVKALARTDEASHLAAVLNRSRPRGEHQRVWEEAARAVREGSTPLHGKRS